MKLKPISNREINYLNIETNKLFLLKSIQNLSNELIINSDNKEIIIDLILKKSENTNNMNSFNRLQKREIIDTGITVILNVINTKAIKQEKKILKKENLFNQKIFLIEYSKKLLSLKNIIENNKKEFLELQSTSEILSLNTLANKINEFHNPNTNSKISDNEIEDLLNGGKIEF
ncbi:hypothetical protein H9W90_10250 [Polaribacter pectinis]|uniref:Uncharacterized protein n=1 Tax=Polaribacter pectinis TaxID=2738844 RepID=A0A7G9L7H8_9FLAO|nr:hypothetical protein [Polaribacter pectinis]QNM84577.1 hypothetical protein H9W90_10250 [Polaribacter pectinis]